MNAVRSRARALAVLAMTGALTLIPALAAQAHVPEQTGPFDYEIGFGTEPAYAGQPNSVELILNKNGTPILNLTDELKVSVGYAGQTTDLAFEPDFEVGGDGVQGDYRAYFVPSQAGQYMFHLTGKLDGTSFDVTVRSGPTTFSPVSDMSAILFPPNTAPTNDQLSTKIDQEAARSQDAVTAAQSAATAANDAAKTAKTLGMLGVVLGAIGITAAIAALAKRKRA
jgi:hypothetical protein